MNWNAETAGYRFAFQIVKKLHENGFIAYFAGGCVRDALMGNPAHDYDVATDARVEQVIDLFGPRNTLAIGAAFGVACVHGKLDGERFQVEVATFRSDGSYSDGRHPDWVNYSSPEEDAKRRDFTINGMFYDPIAREVKDFIGGREDLARQQIRAIGLPEERIGEDKLRMLRAIRFGARFGFSIEAKTWQAIQSHASEIVQVSGERIAAEMRKLFATRHHVAGLESLHRSGLLRYILPELANDWDAHPSHRAEACELLAALPDRDNFAACIAAVSLPTLYRMPKGPGEFASTPKLGDSSAPPLAYWGISSSQAKRWVDSLKADWKLSNADSVHIGFALQQGARLCQTRNTPWSILQPLLVSSSVQTAVELAEAIQIAGGLDSTDLEETKRALAMPLDQLNPAPWLSGDDLKKLGIRPGPAFAKILQEARSRQLDGRFRDRQEAIDWARTNAGEQKR